MKSEGFNHLAATGDSKQKLLLTILEQVVFITVDLIAASIHDKYSVGPSIRPIYTRCCFTMTNMIQVCGIFH